MKGGMITTDERDYGFKVQAPVSRTTALVHAWLGISDLARAVC